MDPEIPGLGTYMAEGYGGGNAPASYTPPPRESEAMPGSQSQVPGTSGAPFGYTPSATPGGVASGNNALSGRPPP